MDKFSSAQSILITGGTGSFGRTMLLDCLTRGVQEVRVFSRDEEKQDLLRNQICDDRVKYYIGDIRDYDAVVRATRGVDVVFHAAALKQVPSCEFFPNEAVNTNFLGSSNVINAGVEAGVSRIICLSTDKAVFPVNAMGMTKALQEKIILSDDLEKGNTKFCCVRYGNVLGSRGSVIPLWDNKIKKNKPLPVTHPEMTRFMLTLTEAIQLVFYALKNSKGGEIFVKKAPATKIVDLAKMYGEIITGRKDYPITYVGRRAGEKIHEVLVSEEEMRNVTEKKDHFIIHRELAFDLNSLKKKSVSEYSSATVPVITKQDLWKLMKNLAWIP